MDSSLTRMLDILRLFTEGEGLMTIDQAVDRTGYSRSTVYRYFRALASAGLLWSVAGYAYALGPHILELDRKIRLNDPLLRAAPPIMAELHKKTGHAVLLGRFYHNRVTCIHQEGTAEGYEITVGRGLPLKLFRGATSKIILANLPTKDLKDIYLTHVEEIQAADLGNNWSEFRSRLRDIRKNGYAIAKRGEVDPDTMGISVPIFDSNNKVLAGLSLVIKVKTYIPEHQSELLELVQAAADKITDVVKLFGQSIDTADAAEAKAEKPEPRAKQIAA